MERACGFDRSELYSDEGPPIGEIGLASRRLIAALQRWLLRWNRVIRAYAH
jgi:hypothetical protein